MKTNRLFKILLAAAALIAIFILWFTIARPVVVLPRQRLAPGYGLQDANGKLVTSEDRRGKLTLYSFAYTRCQETCRPIYDTLRGLDDLIARQPPRSPRLDFITISVDPVYDSPQRLANFEPPLLPRALEWIWLTGSELRIKTVVGEGFEVLFSPQPDGQMVLDPRYVLVDGFGIVRGIYEGAEQDPEKLFYQLDLLYKEIEQSSGSGRLAYEAAHFFACYPH